MAENENKSAAIAIKKAKQVLDWIEREQFEDFFPVNKTIWGSPAGKKKLANRLAGMLPAHKTYVEPFAGSAAVLFAKEPSQVEVLCDADIEIAKAYRIVKRLTKEQIAKLKSKHWKGDASTFKQLVEAQPSGDVESLYRFLYLTHFSYGKLRGKSFSPSGAGVESRTVERIEEFAPRLKNVRVYDGDYLKVVRKYDGPNTVFFLDPPYSGYNVKVGESTPDEERFFDVLKSLKGKFLLTYGIRGKLPGLLKNSSFNVQRIRTPRTIRSMRGVGGPTMLTQLLVTNYKPTEKSLHSDNEVVIEDWMDALEDIEKTQPFGTFGGSHHYAKRIVPLIPKHTTYVEPFAGAAAVLHAKEPVDKEIIADLDPDLVFMHRFIKGLNEDKLDKLKRYDWTCTASTWKRVRDLSPKNDIERFYKLAFIRGKGRDARPDATHPSGGAMGQTTNPEKYLNAAERLKNVTILRQDYRKTISDHDGADTFFFIDPPYPKEWFDKDAVIDLDEFISTLKGIKGSFIAVLNDSPENVAAFKKVGQVFRLKVREASGTGGIKKASRLFCANYRVRKCDDVEEIDSPETENIDKAQWSSSYINNLPDSAFLYVEPGGKKDEDGKTVPRSLRHFPVRDANGKMDLPHVRNAIARIPQSKIPGLTEDDLAKLQDKARKLLDEATRKAAPSPSVPLPMGEGGLRTAKNKSEGEGSKSEGEGFIKTIPLIKAVDPNDERFVFGIVLEPDTVDAQGDIYSADEVREAAHRFMQEFGVLGLMHRFRVNDQVKVLESYLAPVDFTIGDTAVKKGTWLLAVRVLSDELCQQVKDGDLTGFSIGGSARRYPEAETDGTEKSIAKAESPDAGLQPPNSINRLLDIVVEEVSLVDRAANKHRFLIVKRSEDMSDNAEQNNTPDEGRATVPIPENEIDWTENEDDAEAGDADAEAHERPTLENAVSVLQGLIEAVELLSRQEAKPSLILELVQDLHTTADKLSARFGGVAQKPADSQDKPDKSKTETSEKPAESKQHLTALIGTVKETIQRVDAMIPDKKSETPEQKPSPIAALIEEIKALTSAVKDQQQRLSKLEKRFGIQSSIPTGETPRRKETEEVGWPMDMNRSLDKESVDKAVSFHEV